MSKRKDPRRNQRKSAGPRQTITSGRIPRPKSNTRFALSVVPTYSLDDPRSQPPPNREGYRGMYIVTFVLSIPSQDVFHKSVDTHQIMRSGSSQLMVTRKIHEATVQATYGHQQYDVRVSVNSQGFLTSAQLRIHADNFAEAERLGFNILCPILSHLSFTYNVALDFTAYEIKEEKTETTSWWLAILGQPKLLNL